MLLAAWESLGSTGLSCVPACPQGNLFDFLRLTEWRGPRVLYFGDHLYSDLAVRGARLGLWAGEGAPELGLSLVLHPDPQDLMLRHGWRTGAIIPELEREIRIINTEQYMHSLTWQQALTGLLERMQVRAWPGLPGAGPGLPPGHTHPGHTCLPQTYQDAESRQVLASWVKERQELR